MKVHTQVADWCLDLTNMAGPRRARLDQRSPAKTDRGLARKIDRNVPPARTKASFRPITAFSLLIDRASRQSAIFRSRSAADGRIGKRAPGRNLFCFWGVS